MTEEPIPTDHDRIFYKGKGDMFDRGELRIAKEFAKAFPNLKIIITMGPYRGYDYMYQLMKDRTTLEMDFYSVRLPSMRYVLDGIQEVASWLTK